MARRAGIDRGEIREHLRAVLAEGSADLPQDVLDEMAVPSYLRGNALSRFVFWRKLRWVARFAAAAAGEAALDFGCGAGVLLPALSRQFAKVYATDLRLDIARRMTERMSLSNVTFIEPAELAGLGSDILDVVVAANVLEHVPDPPATLRRFGELLSPEGRLIISGPTENVLYRFGRRIIGFSGEYHHRDIQDILSDVREAGFRIARRRRWPAPGPFCLYVIAICVPLR